MTYGWVVGDRRPVVVGTTGTRAVVVEDRVVATPGVATAGVATRDPEATVELCDAKTIRKNIEYHEGERTNMLETGIITRRFRGILPRSANSQGLNENGSPKGVCRLADHDSVTIDPRESCRENLGEGCRAEGQ